VVAPSAVAVRAALDRVGLVRKLATNREDGCTVDDLTASMASARTAIGVCGLGAAFEAKLKREVPAK
jgi:hypothetical protein